MQEYKVGMKVEWVALPGYPRSELAGAVGTVVGHENPWVLVKWPVRCGVCMGDCVGVSHKDSVINLRVVVTA